MPEGRLPIGLGLGAFILFLFVIPLSGTELVLRATGAITLLGRLVFFACVGALGGGGAGRSIILTFAGRTNIP